MGSIKDVIVLIKDQKIITSIKNQLIVHMEKHGYDTIIDKTSLIFYGFSLKDYQPHVNDFLNFKSIKSSEYNIFGQIIKTHNIDNNLEFVKPKEAINYDNYNTDRLIIFQVFKNYSFKEKKFLIPEIDNYAYGNLSSVEETKRYIYRYFKSLLLEFDLFLLNIILNGYFKSNNFYSKAKTIIDENLPFLLNKINTYLENNQEQGIFDIYRPKREFPVQYIIKNPIGDLITKYCFFYSAHKPLTNFLMLIVGYSENKIKKIIGYKPLTPINEKIIHPRLRKFIDEIPLEINTTVPRQTNNKPIFAEYEIDFLPISRNKITSSEIKNPNLIDSKKIGESIFTDTFSKIDKRSHKLLQGNIDSIKRNLRNKMEEAARELDFEKATKIRSQIDALDNKKDLKSLTIDGKPILIPFMAYYPTKAKMSKDQLCFYQWWKSQILDKNEYPSIDNWSSYLFVFIYELLVWEDKNKGFKLLTDLWINYRDTHSNIDKYMLSWLSDFIQVNKIEYKLITEKIAKNLIQSSSKYLRRNIDVIITWFRPENIENIPATWYYWLVRKNLSLTKFNEAIEKILPNIMVKVDEYLKETYSKDLFTYILPNPVLRIAYEGAVYTEDPIEVNYYNYTLNEQTSETLLNVLNYTEKKVRDYYGSSTFRKIPLLLDYNLKNILRKEINEELKKIKIIDYMDFVEIGKHYSEMEVKTLPDPVYVPLFQYTPHYKDLSKRQINYYLYWRTNIRNGKYLQMIDLPYIFLYIYEIINDIGIKDSEEGYNKLLDLWQFYRTIYPNINNYLPVWITQYLLIKDSSTEKLLLFLNKVLKELDLNRYYIQIIEICEIITSKAEQTEKEVPLLVYYTLTKHFSYNPYKKLSEIDSKRYDESVKKIFSEINELYKNKYKKTLLNSFNLKYKNKLLFSQARYYGEENKIEIIDFDEVFFPIAQKTIKQILRRIHNRFRALEGSKQLLKEDERFINKDISAVIDYYFIDTYNAPFSPSVSRMAIEQDSGYEMDESKIEMLVKESDALENLLTIEEEDKIIEPEVEEVVDNSLKDNYDETDEWIQLINSLDPLRLEAIKVLLKNEDTYNTINQLAVKNGFMPDSIIDNINEVAFDIIGDLLIENYQIIEEYREDLRSRLLS